MRLRLLALPLAFAAVPALAALAPGAKAPDFTTRGAINGKVFKLTLSAQLKRPGGAVFLPGGVHRRVQPGSA